MNNSLPCGLAFVKVMSEKHPDRPKRSEEENDTPGTESPNAIRYVRTRHVLKTATLHHFPVGEDCDIATLHHSQLVLLRHCELRHPANFASWCSYSQPRLGPSLTIRDALFYFAKFRKVYACVGVDINFAKLCGAA